jgi:hypothetical protein
MSFLSNLFGGGPNNNQKTANNQLNANAQNASNTGMAYLGNSATNFQAPTSYYASILSGNPSSVAGALSPEINQLGSAYQQQKQQVDQFAPMGGGRAALSAQLPYQQAGAITNMISQARQNAASGLTGIAGTEGALGQGLLGTSTTAASAFDQNAYLQHMLQQQTGLGVGSAIGSLLTGGLLGKIGGLFGGSKGGGGFFDSAGSPDTIGA